MGQRFADEGRPAVLQKFIEFRDKVRIVQRVGREQRRSSLCGEVGRGQQRNPQHTNLVKNIRFVAWVTRGRLVSRDTVPVTRKLCQAVELLPVVGQGLGLRAVLIGIKFTVVEQHHLRCSGQDGDVSLVQIKRRVGAVGIEPATAFLGASNIGKPAIEEEAPVLLCMPPLV